MPIHIKLAQTDTEINACYPVMSELRPHVDAQSFLSRVRRQQQHGYSLAYASQQDQVVAVAGFRLMENLAWGKFLYVDDLVTHPAHRSQGLGAAMLAWLGEYAAAYDCAEVHLDSGLQRERAHRFYRNQGMLHTSHHFKKAAKT